MSADTDLRRIALVAAQVGISKPTRASVKQSDIDRAIRAAKAAGLTIAEIIIEPKSARLKLVAQTAPMLEGPKPKEWPAG